MFVLQPGFFSTFSQDHNSKSEIVTVMNPRLSRSAHGIVFAQDTNLNLDSLSDQGGQQADSLRCPAANSQPPAWAADARAQP
jgi:hypothetical protein